MPPRRPFPPGNASTHLPAGCGYHSGRRARFLLLSACRARPAEEEGPTSAGDPSSDLVLDPTGRKLQSLKIAEATVSGAAHSTAAAGKVAFDEDHTSRVGSPLSGRVE